MGVSSCIKPNVSFETRLIRAQKAFIKRPIVNLCGVEGFIIKSREYVILHVNRFVRDY